MRSESCSGNLKQRNYVEDVKVFENILEQTFKKTGCEDVASLNLAQRGHQV
jgi:hypothetical protein